MAPVPLPEGFRLRFSAGLHRPRPAVLVGGTPLRVLRLTAAGAALVDRWMAGQPVGGGRAAATLAARLAEAGIADPVPPAGSFAGTAVVVVPVRDDQEGLDATLAALATTAPAVPVVVVDDGSVAPVRPATSTVIRRDRPGGPATARNRGWQAAPRSDVVVFVDAGCVPHPGWLETTLAPFADPGCALVAPRVVSHTLAGTRRALAVYEQAHSPLDLGPSAGPVAPGTRVPYVPTATLAVRRRTLEAAAGFDENLRFGEDVDLVWRLVAAGHRGRYEPAGVVSHPARTGWASWLRQRFDYGRSATPLATRHGRAVAPLTVQPWSLAAWGLAASGHLLAGAALAASSAAALMRRASTDRLVACELGRLAVAGHLRAAGPIASVVRRAWLPPTAAAAALAWAPSGRPARCHMAAAGLAVLAGPGLYDWWRSRPDVAPLAWVALGLADDLAYQAGIWYGALRARSAGALLPRW